MVCAQCELVAGSRRARGFAPIARGAFVVHPKMEASAVPGWWVIAPARHVEAFDALTPAEQGALGAIVGEVSAALRASTPAAKIYVSIFAEILPHLHVHVIARPPDLDEALRGPNIFLAKTAADAAEIAAVDARVAARLSRTA